MSPGKIAAQAVHAALGLNEALEQDLEECDYPDRIALSAKLSVVVLEVSDAKYKAAIQQGVESGRTQYAVFDAGRTEVAAGTETVCAFLEEQPKV
jgi:peptidyl-tRNA hydrolase